MVAWFLDLYQLVPVFTFNWIQTLNIWLKLYTPKNNAYFHVWINIQFINKHISIQAWSFLILFFLNHCRNHKNIFGGYRHSVMKKSYATYIYNTTGINGSNSISHIKFLWHEYIHHTLAIPTTKLFCKLKQDFQEKKRWRSTCISLRTLLLEPKLLWLKNAVTANI